MSILSRNQDLFKSYIQETSQLLVAYLKNCLVSCIKALLVSDVVMMDCLKPCILLCCRFERFQYDPLVVHYNAFRDQIIGLFMRRDEWCTALLPSELPHVTHVNNYVEASMRALKYHVSWLFCTFLILMSWWSGYYGFTTQMLSLVVSLTFLFPNIAIFPEILSINRSGFSFSFFDCLQNGCQARQYWVFPSFLSFGPLFAKFSFFSGLVLYLLLTVRFLRFFKY